MLSIVKITPFLTGCLGQHNPNIPISKHTKIPLYQSIPNFCRKKHTFIFHWGTKNKPKTRQQSSENNGFNNAHDWKEDTWLTCQSSMLMAESSCTRRVSRCMACESGLLRLMAVCWCWCLCTWPRWVRSCTQSKPSLHSHHTSTTVTTKPVVVVFFSVHIFLLLSSPPPCKSYCHNRTYQHCLFCNINLLLQRTSHSTATSHENNIHVGLRFYFFLKMLQTTDYWVPP